MSEAQTRPGRPIRLVHVVTAPITLLRPYQGQIGDLRARGFEVEAISSPGPELAKVETAHGLKVHPVPMIRGVSPARDLVSLIHLTYVLARLKPDVVHGSTPKAGLLSMLAAWVLRVPARVYTIRGLRFVGTEGWKLAVLKLTERIACAAASRVLCISGALRDEVVRRGLCPADKIKVIGHGSSNGVDVARFDPDRVGPEAGREFKRSLGAPEDAPVLGFVGRVVKDKGVDDLIAAWETVKADFPEWRLFLIGPDEDEDPIEPETRRRIESDPRVHHAGYVAEIEKAYAALEILVLPTRREGFGNALLEAAAMKLPVVAARAHGCLDAVVDGETGLLVPIGAPAELAAAIRRLIESPESRARMGAAGRRRAERDFRPEAIWDGLYREYLELLDAGGKDRREPARGGPLTPRQEWLKRGLDLLVSTLVLLAFSPVLVPACALILLTMGSPVFFKQKRPGRWGVPFGLIKLRTMTDARDAAGELLSDSERLTWLGKLLRATSLDELPELFNVLKGDMSLVGPRPLLMRYYPYFYQHERVRFEVLPGITGLAQIMGRNEVLWDRRIAYDVEYVKNYSIWLDLKIIVLTPYKILTRSGVQVDPAAARLMLNLDEERKGKVAAAPAGEKHEDDRH